MINIQAATEADLDAILDIENLSFLSPSSRREMESELLRSAPHKEGPLFMRCKSDTPIRMKPAEEYHPDMRDSVANEVSRFFTARYDGVICGYIIFWLVLDEVHLISIAVHPEYRRRKIASKLFQFMLDYVKPGPKSVYLEVRPSNEDALDFYRKMGFEETGLRKKYYPNGEDAVLMKLCIPS
ncbi:MAG: ribosomal protein S18-alanine N-acetyltransferase [Deltaproteobacteria bacterium]|nr:ribosomal protein S18-alanine N-acetyltransferase [Deltaproteobacteria bacterium]